MIVAVLYYHSSIITIMVKNDNVLVYQLYDKNSDRPGTGAKHVKTASFFIKTGFSFVKNSLQSRLRPGCTRHGDPGAGEVQTRVCAKTLTGMWGCLSAMLEVLLCLVFASYSAKKVVLYTNNVLVLSMVILAYININIPLSAI